MTSRRIAVIGGTGREGFWLAVRWAQAGEPVVIGSRTVAKAQEAVGRAAALSPPIRLEGSANADAAASAEIVVLTLPVAAHREILAELRDAVRGKIVVDATVPLRRASPPELQPLPAGSAAAQIQQWLPEARVVSAFHTVPASSLQRLAEPLHEDVLVCGDDAEAKGAVAALIERLGTRAVDAGGLDAAATLERLGALLIGLNQRYRRRAIGLRLTGL